MGQSSGLTLLEAVVFMTLVLMAMVALSHTTVTVHKLQRAEEERSMASQGMVTVIEEVRQTAMSMVGAEPSWGEAFSAALAPGGALGGEFDIAGLDPVDGQPAVCTVTVVTDETLSDDDLGFAIGMPLDLDNDGDATDLDVSDSALMLPVIVRARWEGKLGRRELTQGLLLLGI